MGNNFRQFIHPTATGTRLRSHMRVYYIKVTQIPLTRTCLVILVCREQYEHRSGTDLAGQLSAASIDRASVHAPQELSGRRVVPWSVPVWWCQIERGKRKTNKSAKRRRGNIRQYETEMQLFPQKEIGGRARGTGARLSGPATRHSGCGPGYQCKAKSRNSPEKSHLNIFFSKSQIL